MVLPADSHVHTEWSWDAPDGSMERTCARAVEIGLPAVAFTEHADYTTWPVTASDLDERLQPLIASDGTLTPPELNLTGYLECLQRCRDRFPDLRIISGVELGEPHWHSGVVATLLDAGHFDRVLGSLHSLPIGPQFFEMPELYRRRPATEVVRDYLAEIPRLIAARMRSQCSPTSSTRSDIGRRRPVRSIPTHSKRSFGIPCACLLTAAAR